MSDFVTAAALQELIGSWWFNYDEANYDELGALLTADVHYSSRTDSGTTDFEDFVRAETHGREATLEWLVDHRRNTSYPLRHNGTNVHRAGTDGTSTRFRSNLLVTTIVDGRPFAVSTAIASGAVASEADGLHIAALHVVIDTIDSRVGAVPARHYASEA